MMRTILTYTTIGLLSLTACKKKDDSAGSAKTGDQPAKASDQAAAPKANCPADAVKNEAGGFCLKIPAEWTEKPVKNMGQSKVYEYNKDANTYGVTIHVDPLNGGDSMFKMQVDTKNQMLQTPNHKNLQTGDLPGGGKFWAYEDSDGLWVESLTHNAKTVLDCGTRQSPTDNNPAKPALLEACKTIVAL